MTKNRSDPGASQRQPYVKPQVRLYGDIRSLTAGAGPGRADIALGLGIPGNPGHVGGTGGVS